MLALPSGHRQPRDNPDAETILIAPPVQAPSHVPERLCRHSTDTRRLLGTLRDTLAQPETTGQRVGPGVTHAKNNALKRPRMVPTIARTVRASSGK